MFMHIVHECHHPFRYVNIVIYLFKWYCMVRFWFLAAEFSFDSYFLDGISHYSIVSHALSYPSTSQFVFAQLGWTNGGVGLEAWIILVYIYRCKHNTQNMYLQCICTTRMVYEQIIYILVYLHIMSYHIIYVWNCMNTICCKLQYVAI